MKPEIKLKLKIYLKVLPVYLFHILSFFACAMLYGKYVEAVIFLVAELALRYKFDKTYHCKTSGMCFCFTSCVIWLCVPVVLPVEISYLFGIFIGLSISLISYWIQCSLDNLALLKDKDRQIELMAWRLKKYSDVNIYKMSEEELRVYAASKGLSDIIIDTLVLKVLHNYRWVDIMKERNYSKTAIRYHKSQIIKKLDIEL